MSQIPESPAGPSRRNFLKGAAAASVLSGVLPANAQTESKSTHRPNVVLYCADQMRWDFVGAYGLNPTVKTPNLDRIVARGTSFTGAVTNQPLCSPSRACMMTGRYATETGEWKIGTGMRTDLPTLASVLTDNGYTANFIGKWHLMRSNRKEGMGLGWVPPHLRHGFDSLWEGANEFEWTTHPYYGTIWDTNGNPITYHDQYRVDFVTDRAIEFLQRPQEKPFLLFISQLEPHQQNDENCIIAPRGYAERYKNPYVPPDLQGQPGDWQAELPDYYGCVEKIDESVGRILEILDQQNQLDNTVFLFCSDHGCHFRTRNEEYKRSAQDASIRIPWLMQGPGLNRSTQLPETFGNICLTPTLLDAAGFQVPASMKGRSVLPLLRNPEARENWKNEALIQISDSMVGRVLRTKEWTYCVAARGLDGKTAERSGHYDEYQLYNNFGDPQQLVNLAGRVPFRDVAARLRPQLIEAIVASGESAPEITPAQLYP